MWKQNLIGILTNAGWRFPSFENGSTVRGANTKFSSVRSKCKLSLYTFIQSRFCQSCRSNSTNIWNTKWDFFNELFVNLRSSLELKSIYQIITLLKQKQSLMIYLDRSYNLVSCSCIWHFWTCTLYCDGNVKCMHDYRCWDYFQAELIYIVIYILERDLREFVKAVAYISNFSNIYICYFVWHSTSLCKYKC